MRREIPMIITVVAGLVFAVSYFIPHWPFGDAETIFTDWVSVVQAFAVWLGILNLTKVSIEKIQRKKSDWPYALITVISLAIVLVIGIYDGFSGLNASTQYSFRDSGTMFDWMFRYLYTPLTATMFSILAFFVASASYRAFRARSLEATMLLIAAFFVMAGRVPLGDLLLSQIGFDGVTFFGDFAEWIMAYPNTGGMTAILIGIALGIMSSSLRVILGIERSHIGGE